MRDHACVRVVDVGDEGAQGVGAEEPIDGGGPRPHLGPDALNQRVIVADDEEGKRGRLAVLLDPAAREEPRRGDLGGARTGHNHG